MMRFCVIDNKLKHVLGRTVNVFMLTILFIALYSYSSNATPENWSVYLKTKEHNTINNEEIHVPLKLKWKFFSSKIFNPEELLSGKFYELNPFSRPPMVINEKVFIRDDRGNLYSISLKTGKLLWKKSGQNHCYLAGDKESNLVFSSPSQQGEIKVCALDADTGNTIWDIKLDTKSALQDIEGNSSIAITLDNGAVIVAVSSIAKGHSNIFRLRKDNGSIVWQQIVDNSIEAPPIIFNDRIVILSKLKPRTSPSEYTITLIAEDTGFVLMNQQLGKIRDYPELTLCIMNGNILVKLQEAIILTLDLQTLDRKNVKSFEGAHSIDTYTYDDNFLYLKQNGLICYDIKNDAIKWRIEFKNWGVALPLVTKEYVFVDNGSNIAVVNKETGKMEEVYNLDRYRSRFQVGPNGFERNYIPTALIAVDNILLVACGDGGLYAFEGAS